MDKNSTQLKIAFWGLLNLVLLVVFIFGLKGLFTGSFALAMPRTVTVSAEGKATIVPDIAIVSFSVVSEGKDPKVIQDENTKKMNQAIQFVKDQGIDAKDIKTENYNLSPLYDYSRPVMDSTGRPFIVGYSLSQTVTVKVRDLTKVATVLGGLPAKGINQINGVNFSVDDQDKYLNGARHEAFERARARAEFMAKQAGVKIKKVITFSESNGGGPIFYATAFGKGGGDSAPMPPTIEPGTEEVTVNVSVTYEIR